MGDLLQEAVLSKPIEVQVSRDEGTPLGRRVCCPSCRFGSCNWILEEDLWKPQVQEGNEKSDTCLLYQQYVFSKCNVTLALFVRPNLLNPRSKGWTKHSTSLPTRLISAPPDEQGRTSAGFLRFY